MPFITQAKTNLKYILIVTILAVMVAGGTLVYWWQIKKEEIKAPDLINAEEPEDETEFFEPIDIADWQTYRNQKYGFEFLYPAEMYVGQSDETIQDLFYIYDYPSNCGGSCETPNMRIKFGGAENENLLPISEWVNKNVDMAAEMRAEDQPMTVDGIKGLKRIYKDEAGREIAILVFFPDKDNNRNVIYYFATSGMQNMEILEQLISTFHFVK